MRPPRTAILYLLLAGFRTIKPRPKTTRGIGTEFGQRCGRTGDRIDQVVMTIGAMVDTIFATTGDPAFQAEQLLDEPTVIQQFDAA